MVDSKTVKNLLIKLMHYLGMFLLLRLKKYRTLLLYSTAAALVVSFAMFAGIMSSYSEKLSDNNTCITSIYKEGIPLNFRIVTNSRSQDALNSLCIKSKTQALASHSQSNMLYFVADIIIWLIACCTISFLTLLTAIFFKKRLPSKYTRNNRYVFRRAAFVGIITASIGVSIVPTTDSPVIIDSFQGLYSVTYAVVGFLIGFILSSCVLFFWPGSDKLKF